MSETIAFVSGWLAPMFVILSFLLKKVEHIRAVNLIGSILFIIYGITNGILYPIIIPNIILAGVQIYFLIKKIK